MRLPDEYRQKKRISGLVLATALMVGLFVLVLFFVVLLLNGNEESAAHESTQTSAVQPSHSEFPDTKELLGDSKRSPEDFDFWDKYPAESEETQVPVEEESEVTEEEPDPSTDGKHVRIINDNGEEEWVLISPHLPKHEYVFTNLVSQSGIMKYYVDGTLASKAGVTITKYQDSVDFAKMKKAGIDYVMLRAGQRGYGTGQIAMDENFANHLKDAKEAGLAVGIYFSSQAITKEEAVEEAGQVMAAIGEYTIEYPIAFDMSHILNDKARTDTLSRAEKTAIAKAFTDAVQTAGYKSMICGDKEWLIKEVDYSKLTGVDIWYRENTDIPDYPYKFAMWQYTEKATIDGVAGYVTLDLSFIDYSAK